MSYSPRAAVDERATDVYHALQTRDSEALRNLATLYKEEGYDEIAESLQVDAKRIDQEDMAYDEERDNNLD